MLKIDRKSSIDNPPTTRPPVGVKIYSSQDIDEVKKALGDNCAMSHEDICSELEFWAGLYIDSWHNKDSHAGVSAKKDRIKSFTIMHDSLDKFLRQMEIAVFDASIETLPELPNGREQNFAFLANQMHILKDRLKNAKEQAKNDPRDKPGPDPDQKKYMFMRFLKVCIVDKAIGNDPDFTCYWSEHTPQDIIDDPSGSGKEVGRLADFLEPIFRPLKTGNSRTSLGDTYKNANGLSKGGNR